MDYNGLLDLASDLGYELAMSGAETFRVEESVSRCLAAYGISAEVFAIPNYLIVSILTEEGQPITRMRRIGYHGNDLDAVEKFNALSRAICNRKPSVADGQQWLEWVRNNKSIYSTPMIYLGNFLAAAGFCLFFGGNFMDFLLSGICGMVVGLVAQINGKLNVNPFFRSISAAFLMSLTAYAMGAFGLTNNPDALSIGALMILVPGLLITNAMRDIIYGDTNSGVNRLVQVLLTAAALALGTAASWRTAEFLWGTPVSVPGIVYSDLAIALFSFVACYGFTILFNIHGVGTLLASLGGALTWLVYCLALKLTGSELFGYFWSALFAAVYAEGLARVRKYPAISYLVISIFTLIPGSGVYYTMVNAVQGNMDAFVAEGMFTGAIAGSIAVGILLGSSVFRAWYVWKTNKK